MNTKFLKITAVLGLMSASGLAIAAGNCCGDMAECCLQLLACCF